MFVLKDVIQQGKIALERYSSDSYVRDKKLLFVHSAGTGSWMWKNFLNYFAQNGYESWGLNLRGHHLAPPVEDWGQVGAEAYLEDIESAVKLTGENVVLIGHSMSGLLVLKCAERLDVRAVIVSQSGPPRSVMEQQGIEIGKPETPEVPRASDDKVISPVKDREAVISTLFDKNNVDDESISIFLEKMGEESVRAAGEIVNLEISPEKIAGPVYILGFDTGKLGMKMPVDINRLMAESYNAKGFAIIEPGGHNYMLERNWRDYAVQFEAWLSL
jgi:pimeloyl-ACP methyl ester carboxylesterase